MISQPLRPSISFSWSRARALIGLLSVGVALPGCVTRAKIQTDQAAGMTTPPPAGVVASSVNADPHSLSNPAQVRVQHMGLDWTVDMEKRQLHGRISYLIDRIDAGAPLRLDTAGLEIESVFVAKVPAGKLPSGAAPSLVLAAPDFEWRVANWRLGDEVPLLGRALSIDLPPDVKLVEVRYHTPKGAPGLQWLDGSQSGDGVTPFLYTQSQAILGRSWIPSQDSPAVRVTYDARVNVPSGLTALMSAEMLDHLSAAVQSQQDHGARRVFHFRMDQAIPAYLIALAVGNLEFASLGPRSGVWAAPRQLKAASYELGELESMISRTEEIFGPYRWGRYDVLILPPAFPMGGMENPRMTFATPTILAGDRSLTSLIAHELAHSWSGNLVTNSTWNDIWLNEGFTTYAERRIVEALYGRERAEMEAMLGRQDLEKELNEDLADKPDDQLLAADVRGRDPDAILTDVAYEKGALFLRRLEECYGRETFDPFLRAWFDGHAFQSATTDEFVDYLQRELLTKATPLAGQTVPDLQLWLHAPGLPKDAPAPSSDAFARVERELAAFASGAKKAEQLAVNTWNAQQWLHFLRALGPDLKMEQLAALDHTFGFTQSGNSEIVAQWLEIAAERRYEPAFARLESFLTSVGRRKFLMPIYSALLKTPAGRIQARAIFEKAKAGYHSISRESIADLLESADRMERDEARVSLR
jgi:aminopeptidase N